MTTNVSNRRAGRKRAAAAVLLTSAVVASGCVGLQGLKKSGKGPADSGSPGLPKTYESYNRAVGEDTFKSMLDDGQNSSLRKFVR